MDPTQVAKEVEAILAAADFESAVDTATQREQEALNRLSEQRYNEAFHQCDVAAEIYHRLSDGQEPDAPISIALSLAWAKTRLTHGAALRRAGTLPAAAKMYQSAEERLKEVSAHVFELEEKHQELTFDWATTTGVLLMNQGVLYSDVGEKAEALDAWEQSEELLFELYLRSVGPDADLECAGHVINLWDNILSAATDLDDVERASTAVENAFKLFLWWPSQEKEHPDEIADAFGSLLATINELSPTHRAQLDAHLPEQVQVIIEDLLSD